MKIAVLQYSSSDVDIIDVTEAQIDEVCQQAVEDGDWEFDDEYNDDERIQCYLSCHCQYSLSECNYMCGSDDYPIKVNNLTHGSFNDYYPWWRKESEELYHKHTSDITPIYKDDDISIFISNKNYFGDEKEHEMHFDYYDGYAIGNGEDVGAVLLYPTLATISQEPRLQYEIKRYCRGYDSTADDDPIRVDESAVKLGILKHDYEL